MSLIYECDGCGKQSKTHREINLVSIEVKTAEGQGADEYHVCPSCKEHLLEMSNPKRWVRAASERVA